MQPDDCEFFFFLYSPSICFSLELCWLLYCSKGAKRSGMIYHGLYFLRSQKPAILTEVCRFAMPLLTGGLSAVVLFWPPVQLVHLHLPKPLAPWFDLGIA